MHALIVFRSIWQRRQIGAVLCVTLIAIVLISLISVEQVQRSRAAALVEAQRNAETLSRALGQQVDGMIAAADLVLSGVVERLQINPNRNGFQDYLTRRTLILPQVGNILVSEKGAHWSGRSSDNKADHTEESEGTALQWFTENPTARGSQLETLFEPGPTTQVVILLSRRVNNPDGSMAGIASAVLRPEYLEHIYAGLALGQRGSISLWRDTGYLIVRHPAIPKAVGKNFSAAQLLTELAKNSSGAFRAKKSIVDGLDRIVAFDRLERFPQLLVTVSLTVDDILAPWRQDATLQILISSVAIIILAALSGVLEWHRRRLRDAQQEQRTAQDEVADSNRSLLLAEQIAHVGHWRLDVRQATVTWSDEVYRIHGLDRSTFPLNLQSAIAAYHPEDRSKVVSLVETAIATGNSFEFSLRLVRPCGEIRYVMSRGLCEPVDAEGVRALFGTIVDLTDLRRAEEAVRESEARYRLLAETTSDVITSLDLDFKRTYVSPACRTVLGFEPDELIGKRPSDSIHPDDVQHVRDVARKLFDGATATTRVTATYRTRHKTGLWVWIEAGMSLGHDETTGRANALICSLRDVTERRRAEAAVEASEARYRLLAENTSELIVLGHDDGRRSYISPASTRLLGFTPKEMLDLRLRDFVHPEDLTKLFETTRRLGSGEAEVAVVYRALNKHHGWIWVEGVFRRIQQGLADDPTIVATFRDVSERVLQSEALREAKEAAERAQATAEQASRAKTEFLAAMSHEIRTPLNGIIGYTDLILEDETLTGDRRRQVERIQTSGSALLTVVNDILDFSKIEAGQIDLALRAFSLERLVDNTMSIIRGLARNKQLTLEVKIDPIVPRVLIGDEDRLRQILLNLLNNAVKFTHAGSVELAIHPQESSPEGIGLLFVVTDTGIGIPEEKRFRLFERFSQVDGSINREFGGTGLGLAICKSLVELMGGEIGIDPARQGGSSFYFKVRLPVADEAALFPVVSIPKSFTSIRASILLVEDVEINQDIARAVIEGAGHTLDIVNDGADAIAAVKRKSYDVVLMDIQMPGMDGITASKRIRALKSPHADVPIIAMTANVLPAQIAEFRAAGMNDHVGKPFKRPELYAAIERWAIKQISQ